MRVKVAQKRPVQAKVAAASLAPPRPFATQETVQGMPAAVAGAGHDLARVSVSAPAGAPIQRVQWPWMMPGASEEERYRPPPPPRALAPPPAMNQQAPPAQPPALIPPVPAVVNDSASSEAPPPSLQPLAMGSASSPSNENLAPPSSSSAVVPSLPLVNDPSAPNPLVSSVPARRLDDIEAASDHQSAAPPSPSPRNRGRSAELLESLLEAPASVLPSASSSSRFPAPQPSSSSRPPAPQPSSSSRPPAPRPSSSGNPLRQPLLAANDNHPLAQAYGSIQAPGPAAAQIKSRPFSGQDVREFVTANTPGPITGVSGLTSTAVSLKAGAGNTPTGALGKVGLGANIATGAADAVGLLSDMNTVRQMGASRFVSGLGRTITRTRGRNAQEAEDRSASKRVVANTVQNAWDATNQASSILTATGRHVPQALGAVASGAGVGVNALVAGRSAYRAIRAQKHESAMNREIARGRLSPAMQAAAQHHADQMNTRKKRSWLGFGGAALGVAGGAMLLAGMATPVGWGLAAAGGLVAAGLGAYKLGRWAYKKYKGTLGVDREKHAQTLHTAINDPRASAADRNQATRLLRARGITPAEVTGTAGKDLLKRKAEAW